MNEEDTGQLREAFEKIGFMEHMDSELFTVLTTLFQKRTYEKDEIIIKKDETGNSFSIITRGKASVSVEDEEGRVKKTGLMGEGDFFGEIALIAGGGRTASITAAEKVETFFIRKNDLQSYLMTIPEIRKKILLAARTRVQNQENAPVT
jgi:CRP-like cAMP-binding protein